MRRSATVLVLASAFFAATLQAPAIAAPYQISGTVRNLAGHAVPGVTVSDGTNSSVTNSQGQYLLQETIVGSYTITGTKPGAESIPASATVTLSLTVPQATQDFQLRFTSTATINSGFLSTATASNTITYSVVTGAPTPGQTGTAGASCAYVTDSRTSATWLMTYQSSANQMQTWSWSSVLPAQSEEGSYTLSGLVKDCASGTQIDAGVQSIPYMIDNKAPYLLPQFTSPSDHGNTVFLSQPLTARIFDKSSGIADQTAITFTLTDETTSANSAHQSTSFSPASGWAKTDAVGLVAGHVYRVSVRAIDRAGNVMIASQDPENTGGGFVATSVVPSSTTARIPATQCSVGSVDPQTGERPVTCSGVVLNLDPTSVSVSGSRRINDTGYAMHSVPLAGAIVSSTVAGVPVSKTVYPAAETTMDRMPFDVPVSANPSPAVLSVPAHAASMGTVATTVPGTWTTATLSMDPVVTSASVQACADPSISSSALPCVSDPLQNRYLVYLSTPPSNLVNEADNHASAYKAQVSKLDDKKNAYYASVPPDTVGQLATSGNVSHVIRDAFQDTIDWWGTGCAGTRVFVRLVLPQGLESKDTGMISSKSSCDQSAEVIIRIPSVVLRPTACDNPSEWSSGYIHTHHTIQGFANDTLAWFRTNYGRSYNNCDIAKWWQTTGYMEAWTGTGPSWWAQDTWPTFGGISWDQQAPRVGADVDSNLITGDPPGGYHCDIELNTYVEALATGGDVLDSTKERECDGTRSAVGIEQDQSRNGPWWHNANNAPDDNNLFTWGVPCSGCSGGVSNQFKYAWEVR